jgi:putative Mg2+ transporter-C (MgtC) family protein
MIPLSEDILKLLLAIFVGGLIGAEREFRDKVAGFRTNIFICVGATLFTIFSIRLGGDREPARIAANIVSGVGFLGAGAILRGTGRIVGLTTASTIWLAAGLGMGIGGGYYIITITATVLVLIVLWLFPFLERLIDNLRHATPYEIICSIEACSAEDIHKLVRDSGLHLVDGKRTKSEEDMVLSWTIAGTPRNHKQLVDKLFVHAGVKSFKC